MTSAAAASSVSRRFLGSAFLILLLLLAVNGDNKFVTFPAGSWNSNVMKNLPAPEKMCFHVQRIRHYCPPFPATVAAPPPPPASPEEMEIDPRYGVEKRLVPSGPNPLHN